VVTQTERKSIFEKEKEINENVIEEGNNYLAELIARVISQSESSNN